MSGSQSDLGFAGLRPTTSVINAHSAGGTIAAFSANSARGLLSGALAASTLATLIDVPSGSGRMPLCGVITNDATARTVRLKVTVDGVVVFDATSASTATSATGIFAAGAVGIVLLPAEPIVYLRSLKVEIASSLAETDKLTLLYMHHGV